MRKSYYVLIQNTTILQLKVKNEYSFLIYFLNESFLIQPKKEKKTIENADTRIFKDFSRHLKLPILDRKS